MKKILIFGGLIVVLIVGGSWWSRTAPSNDPDLISRTGIHWHPTLEILVGEEEVSLPAGIGLVGGHSSVHTHEDVPTMHYELSGRVTKNDIQLQRFFDTWGKDIQEFGQNVVMTVNGKINTELGEYEVEDGDAILLRYE